MFLTKLKETIEDIAEYEAGTPPTQLQSSVSFVLNLTPGLEPSSWLSSEWRGRFCQQYVQDLISGALS
jgi:hypothetical protein